MADDAAVRLGRRLMATKQLTATQVREAVQGAREEQKREDERKLLRKLVTDAAFVVRLSEYGKMRAELRRIAKAIMEVCGEA